MAKKSDNKLIELENEELEPDFSALSLKVNIREPYPKPICDVFRDFKEDKIILQPEFQREFVWNSKKQAELIKSLWRGIPLPMFYFSVNNGKWEIIDGQQRLTTIFGYIKPQSIKDKKIRKSLVKKVNIKDENKNIQKEQVIQKIKNNNTRIYCVEIPEDSQDANDKFEIFRALNQGATPLKVQEVRNAIFQKEIPDLNNALKNNAKKLERLVGMKNNRMIFEDLVLRFYIINKKGYEKKVSDQLNNNNELKNIFNSKDIINKLTRKFRVFIKFMEKFFKEKSFQVLSKDNKKNRKLPNNDWNFHQFTGKMNQGLFHLFSYYLPQYDANQLNRKQPKRIRKGLLKLLKNKKFLNEITGSSTDGTRKIKKSKEIFEKEFMLPCLGDPEQKERRSITREEKKLLLENIPYCYLCYGKLKRAEYVEDFKEIPAEHIRSHKSGAKGNYTNILLAHRDCNSVKSSNTLEKYRTLEKSIRERKKNKGNINEYLSCLKEWNKRYPLRYYKKLVKFAKKDKRL